MDLPRWKCHKEVLAAKIKDMGVFSTGELQLNFDDGIESVVLPPGWIDRFKPQSGGYFVVYDDNYTSFSPAKAFEDGYTRIDS